MNTIARFLIACMLITSVQKINCSKIDQQTIGQATKNWPRIIAGAVSIFSGAVASVCIVRHYDWNLSEVRAKDAILPVSLFGGGYSLIKRGLDYHENQKNLVKDIAGFVPIVGGFTIVAARAVNRTPQDFDCREEG